MMSALRRTLTGLLLFASLGLVTAARAAEGTPAAAVERLHDALIEVMKDGTKLGYEGRQKHLEPVVRAIFDLPIVAHAMLFSHWKSLSTEQRAAVTDAFTRLAVASLAANFKRYDGERFEVKSNHALRDGRVRVRCDLSESDGEIVKLDYVLHRAVDGWRVTNVWFDGVSERQIRGAEFSSIIRREGFDSLMKRLAATITAMGK